MVDVTPPRTITGTCGSALPLAHLPRKHSRGASEKRSSRQTAHIARRVPFQTTSSPPAQAPTCCRRLQSGAASKACVGQRMPVLPAGAAAPAEGATAGRVCR